MASASQVNRAGKILRDWHRDPDAIVYGPPEIHALRVLSEFRASHSNALLKANNGLRAMIRTEGCEVQVSQRLKRTATIIDKLLRHPSMALSTMQDIGGCRAVLNNIDEVRRVERRLTRNRHPVKVDDYVLKPQISGYRAVHIVVIYDDKRVEVQLRTRRMHQWAVSVEQLGSKIRHDLKNGLGPEPVLAWLAAIAEALAIEDEGKRIDGVMVQQILRLREDAVPFIS